MPDNIDLTQYGFTQGETTDRWTDYTNADFKVTIFNYFVKTFDSKEIIHNTFLVSSQQFTSRSRPITELGDWLKEKNIQKINP